MRKERERKGNLHSVMKRRHSNDFLVLLPVLTPYTRVSAVLRLEVGCSEEEEEEVMSKKGERNEPSYCSRRSATSAWSDSRATSLGVFPSYPQEAQSHRLEHASLPKARKGSARARRRTGRREAGLEKRWHGKPSIHPIHEQDRSRNSSNSSHTALEKWIRALIHQNLHDVQTAVERSPSQRRLSVLLSHTNQRPNEAVNDSTHK